MTGLFALRERFAALLEQHVSKLKVRGSKATGCCPFHPDRTPSFSADLEKCVWHCFGCGDGGGVKDFAELVGEPWGSPRSEIRFAKARRARFHAKQQALTILARRAEAQHKALCAEHRQVHAGAVAAADLLGLFHRRADLEEEFPDLIARAEKEYGETLFRMSMLAARLDGELT